MGCNCNRKVKLLVYELFRGGGGSKRSYLLRRTDTLHKMQRGGKTDLLIEQRSLSDSGLIISLPIAVGKSGKSISGRPRPFGAFVRSSDSRTLHNGES